MRVSRRQFLDRFRQVADRRWREKRITELREYALTKAPEKWTDEQKQALSRAVEERLAYMSDDTLRGTGMRRYVDSIVESRTLYYNSTNTEEDYYREGDPYYNDYPR